jgi:hypothetical protein
MLKDTLGFEGCLGLLFARVCHPRICVMLTNRSLQACAGACAESTIALMAFPDPTQSPLKGLMAASQRQLTASELNSAILCKYCQEEEPRLAALLKMLSWGQEKLSASVKFPKLAAVVDSDIQRMAE